MTGLRDIKDRGRRDLHRAMAVPALYLLTPDADPVPVTVRLHTKFGALGVPTGSDADVYAGSQEVIPKIIFLRDELDKPARNAIVSVVAGEAYTIDNVLPPDGITVTAQVTQLSASEAEGLPVPER